MVWWKSDLKKLYESYEKLVDSMEATIRGLEMDREDIRQNTKAILSKLTSDTTAQGQIPELYYQKVDTLRERFEVIYQALDTTAQIIRARRGRAIDIRDQLAHWLRKEEDRETDYSLAEIDIR